MVGAPDRVGETPRSRSDRGASHRGAREGYGRGPLWPCAGRGEAGPRSSGAESRAVVNLELLLSRQGRARWESCLRGPSWRYPKTAGLEFSCRKNHTKSTENPPQKAILEHMRSSE